MKESYIKELASHDGPEPCVGVPRGRSEALDRGVRRRAIEPRNESTGVPTRLTTSEGNTVGDAFASRQRTPRGLRTWHVCDLSVLENRESPRSPVVVDDAPPFVGRGVACRRAAGRAGNTKVVIP